MVGTSQSSIKDSVPSPQAHAKTPIASKFQQPRDEGDGDDADDGTNTSNDRDQDEDEDELQITQTTRPENMNKTRKMLATSKSLPNLLVHTTTSTTPSTKRPRSSPSTSPSPPPHPPPLSHAPRPSPRRTPKRAPLTNRHPSTSQQTTLDKFFGGNTIKDNNNNNPIRAETETQRPTKKSRLDRDADAAIGAHISNSASAATTTNQQSLDNRESPDPLNVISPPPNGDRVRTRQRSNTLTTSAATGNSTIPAEAAATSRSLRNKAHPVIIADDSNTTKTNNEEGVNAQNKPTNNAAQAPEKRSLRSHDGGSRSKSELALYFPNYEQIISLEPVKKEFLAPETTVTILDDLTESPLPLPALESGSPSRTRKQRKSIEQISPFGNPLLDLNGVEKIELPKVEENGGVTTDPLNDDVYFKAHRRHERQEKQLRNIEKERAQHEKIQLDRLLDELQGHDWLRVMGISGITDTEKKLYEPKRDYFMKEVSALIDKFRIWKEEEKRRKHEREQMLLEAANAAAQKEERGADEEVSEREEVEGKPSSSDIQSYDSSELDAAAAQQLLQEARSATATGAITSSPSTTPSHPQPRRRLVDELTSTPPKSRSHHNHHRPTNSKHTTQSTTTTHNPPLLPQTHQPEIAEYDESKAFTSFYPKRHLRDAAFSSSRRGGRNRSAFGQPLPEILEEREFELPPDILTPEIVSSLERKRRRLKRESRGD
ncbi:conserved hypothetical protein [Talaromyces stipitatus ATCC 10500]|uniref:Something about silencing protein 4 domain-containing protein n=1 Tax=Talaromyces stipitatus (strain ATCC 10500 / CBS 375.48 / QM 6759 / NRRL 1006) TaxID=441959 RepID=B8MRY8_TALSN|nr:uncharacterized protein TSTA_059120 [Talaromyces stipitatus ATCC 10500]EED13424.1 conserved hypothetical protein [Talaromyces stipitatus ATCC 10500]